MPTYEYACRTCATHVEVVQRFDDEALKECPTCGGDLRKVFGSIGISFKGSGFYKTDSRKVAKAAASSKSKAEGGDSSSASSPDSGASTGTDGGKGSDTKSTSTKESTSTAATPASSPRTPAKAS